MKRWIKRFAVAMMSVALILTMMPLTGGASYADDRYPVTEGGYDCYVWPGTESASVGISGYKGTDTQLILPTSVTFNGTTYTTGSNGFYHIMEGAFKNNTSITKVAIPKDYEHTGSSTFEGCTSLTEVAIGDGVDVGSDAFKGCTNLKNYYFGNIGGLDENNQAGIGTNANGDPIAGVTVCVKENSPVHKTLKAINDKRPEGTKFNFVFSDDPYAQNTVKPENNPAGGTDPADPTTPGTDDQGDKPSSTDATKSDDSSATKGKDGTSFGSGASESVVDKAATSWKKETDPAGTVFYVLCPVAKAKKTSVTLKWKKVKNAKKYVVYGNECGKTKKLKKLVKKTTKTTYTFKKVNGKNVKKGTYYKFMVVAINKKGKVISSSKIVHVATSGGKYCNDKKVTTKAKKNKVTLKVKKTFKLKAKPVKTSKKLKIQRHRGIKYESTNKKIAKVSSKGVIKGLKKGKCYVYAYAQDGIYAKIRVTVK